MFVINYSYPISHSKTEPPSPFINLLAFLLFRVAHKLSRVFYVMLTGCRSNFSFFSCYNFHSWDEVSCDCLALCVLHPHTGSLSSDCRGNSKPTKCKNSTSAFRFSFVLMFGKVWCFCRVQQFATQMETRRVTGKAVSCTNSLPKLSSSLGNLCTCCSYLSALAFVHSFMSASCPTCSTCTL